MNMHYVTFDADRNNRGQIRIAYTLEVNTALRRTTVQVEDIQFLYLYDAYACWRTYGKIRLDSSSGDTAEYTFTGDDNEEFYTYEYIEENLWVSMLQTDENDLMRGSLRLYVDHDETGAGSFTVKLQKTGSRTYFLVKQMLGDTGSAEWKNNKTETAELADATEPVIELSMEYLTIETTEPEEPELPDPEEPEVCEEVVDQFGIAAVITSEEDCEDWMVQVDGGEWIQANSVGARSAWLEFRNVTGTHSYRAKATRSANGVTGYSNTETIYNPGLILPAESQTTDTGLSIEVQNSWYKNVLMKVGDTLIRTYTNPLSGNWTQSVSAADLQAAFGAARTQQTVTVTFVLADIPETAVQLTLTAGDNMRPAITTPELSIVQAGQAAQYYPNVYIAGVSKAKVAALLTPKYTDIVSAVCTYGSNEMSMSYNSASGKYEATTAPLTGDAVFVVRVTDARGMVSQSSVSLTGVVQYTTPSVVIDQGSTYRCDNLGDPEDGGPYVRVRAVGTCDAGLSGNILTMDFYILEDGASSKHAITSGVQSGPVALVNPGPNSVVTVYVEAIDRVGWTVTRWIRLTAAHRDLVLMRDGDCTELGIGLAPAKRYARDTYKAAEVPLTGTIDLPELGGLFYGGVNASDFAVCAEKTEGSSSLILQHNALEIDERIQRSEKNQALDIRHGTGGGTWTNLPAAVSGGDFRALRLVTMLPESVFVILIEYSPTVGRIWINHKQKNVENAAASAWSGWKCLAPTV